MKLKQFYVEGAGEFPYDMLRYDMCWPASETASMFLTRNAERRRILLETFAGNDPTVARWHSFNWQVEANR